MKINYYHLITIGVATVLAWLFLRRNNPGAVSITPNTAGASVNPNDPGVQTYNSPAGTQPSPSQIVNTPPFSFDSTSGETPDYLTYNFPPAGNFNQSFGGIKTGDTNFLYAPGGTTNNLIIAAQGGASKPSDNGSSCNCGSCQTCADDCVTLKSRFTDGRGGCMASSRRAQVQQIRSTNPGLFDRYLANLASANGMGIEDVIQVVGYDHRNQNGSADPGTPGSQVPAFYRN